MNLELLYPAREEGFKTEDPKGIPNKNGAFSGYYLLAMVRSCLVTSVGRSTTIDRYVCFSDETFSNVWIEKLTIFKARKWFVFEDTIKIESDEEFNEVLNFLKNKKILDKLG